ncbi:MAG: 50S ribosomal protein L30 [Fervidicoccaceae archaeon]
MEAEKVAVRQGSGNLIAIIRLKGRVNIKEEEEKTLQLLRLKKKYNMSVYPKDLPGLDGMLNKVRHLVTWGEINEETLEEVLRKRGRISGNRRLNDAALKELFNIDSVHVLAQKIFNGEIKLHEQEKIKPIFRLHPPKGGFKRSTRKYFEVGGELGYRGDAINELIRKMI